MLLCADRLVLYCISIIKQLTTKLPNLWTISVIYMWRLKFMSIPSANNLLPKQREVFLRQLLVRWCYVSGASIQEMSSTPNHGGRIFRLQLQVTFRYLTKRYVFSCKQGRTNSLVLLFFGKAMWLNLLIWLQFRFYSMSALFMSAIFRPREISLLS